MAMTANQIVIATAGDHVKSVAMSGDATMTGLGVVTVAARAVTYAKMQTVTATARVLGRTSAGAGDVEEIPCTAFAMTLLDDADAATWLATLGTFASSTYTANSMLYATTAATPVALTLAANRFPGRASTGAIVALTVTDFALSIMDDADEATFKATVNLEAGIDFTALAHTHAGTTNGNKLLQANTHETPDTDAATSSLHHTIGTTATTAAAGNHGHASLAADLTFTTATTGPVVKDRTTGTLYRIMVDNGVFGAEEVV
jgi:hypothetical protein